MFNSNLSILDGAGVSSRTLTTFVFSEVEDQGFTQLHVANPTSEPAQLTWELIRSDGTLRSAEATRTVNGNGVLAELFTELS